MDNDTNTVFITIPVGEAVVKNVTDDLETKWLRVIVNAMQHLNLSNEHYSIIVMILMLCLLALMVMRFVLKKRFHFLCERKNEA